MQPVEDEDMIYSEPLIKHLESKGWKLINSESDIAVLRKIVSGQEEEIILPRDRNFADYHQRVQEAVRFLVKLENSSEKKIIEELLFYKWDILRIRVKGDKIGLGYIPYLDKKVIEESIRKILLAAARSVCDPKAYFKRLYSFQAEQWMKKCKALAPESGSYVIAIQFPLEEDTEEVFSSRIVAEYLMKSLGQLVKLSEKYDLTLEQQNLNLNANLCLALAEMKPDDASIDCDFEMKWSSKTTVGENVPTKVEIHDRYFPSIMRIGQKLMPKSEVNKKDVFIGKILILNGQADEDENMQGEVTLALFIDEEQTIKAKASFVPKYYLAACDVHKENKYIRISGTLIEKPRCSELKDIDNFEVI